MIGAFGADADGDWMLGILADEGVDTGGITRSEAPTGQAFVFVEPGGESTIVVAPGANGTLSAAGLDGLADRIAAARCVLAQQEVPAEVVARASELCRGMFVLNPAPARPISEEVLRRVDVLVPNRHELAALAGVPGTDDITALAEMAGALEGPRIVVVTLGAHGALVVDEGGPTHVPAIPVDAIDATAAGDTFCSALTDGLLNGASAVDATRWAVRVAALTVQRLGAMGSIPRRGEVDGTTDRG
jgi:ribokinase